MQQYVDEQVARGRFVVVASVRRSSCLRCCDLGLELGDLGFVFRDPLVLLGELPGMRFVLLAELDRESSDLVPGQRRGLRR